MEKLDNVATAFVNQTVTLLLTEDKPLDEKSVAETLKKMKIAVTETKKVETLPF